MNTIGITFQKGGLSGIRCYNIENDQSPDTTQLTMWRGRAVKDITHIHLEEEVFLLGNLYSLKKLGTHLARGVLGFIAGAGTLGILWITSKQIRQLTANLFQIPRDIFRCIPIFGNKMAARENLDAFEKAEEAEKAEPQKYLRSLELTAATQFYSQPSVGLPQNTIFLKNTEPFNELRRLAFAYKDSSVETPDNLENQFKDLLKQLPFEDLYLLAIQLEENSSLSQYMPKILKEVFACMVVGYYEKELIEANGNENLQKDVIKRDFAKIPLIWALGFPEKMWSSDGCYKDYAISLPTSQQRLIIRSSVWRSALSETLLERYNGSENYLAALPVDYLKKLYHSGGYDPVTNLSFTKVEVETALSNCMGGLSGLSEGDWGKTKTQ